MTNSSPKKDLSKKNSVGTTRADHPLFANEPAEEKLSGSIAILQDTIGRWFSDLGKLFGAEVALSVASLNRLLLLTLLMAQAIVLFVIFAFLLIALTLHETLNLGAFELSGIGLLATGLMILLLKRLLRSTRDTVFPTATIDQVAKVLSACISALNPKVKAASDENKDSEGQTNAGE